MNMMTLNQKDKKVVALQYQEGFEAPIIVAKGKGKKAEVIIEEAEKYGIPVKEDEVLVETLGLVETGSVVPQEVWNTLAEIFAVILKEESIG